jgi:hypothetical protein
MILADDIVAGSSLEGCSSLMSRKFAEKYQINDLKDLVIRKLHRALMDTTFHPLRVGEFVELIQLAYKNTPDLKSKEICGRGSVQNFERALWVKPVLQTTVRLSTFDR